MNRPRVLCVSSDRSTRATVTLSLADAPVNVIVAQSSAMAVDRLEHEDVDAVVVDASTVANVPGLLEAVEERHPGIPAFVHWSDETDSSITVLTEVIARTGASTVQSTEELAAAITDRTDAKAAPAFDRLVGQIQRRLADSTSPGEIERAIREPITADDRFAFAWVGEYDRGEREIVPWLTDIGLVEWPMHRTFSIGDGSQPVLERTLHSREIQTVDSVRDNHTIVPLGETAVSNQVESLVVAPLATDDDRYGVLVVYGLEPVSGALEEAIQLVSETASYALESVAVRGRLDQREQTLRRYERLVETAGDGMYVLDDEGHVTTINDALLEMTGYSREGVLGEHVSLLFELETETESEHDQSLRESDASTDTVEVELECKDGRTIPCEIQLADLFSDAAYRGSVGVVRDITERKQRERTLRRQNERLDAFARIVSHDLRNPLGVAQGYLDLLEETRSFDHTPNIREGLDRMEAIIADVLAIAREGDWAATPESVELESIATDAWENVSTGTATLSIDGSMTIDADRSRMLRLLENLFRNSIEHGREPDSDDPLTVRVGAIETQASTAVTQAALEAGSDGQFEQVSRSIGDRGGGGRDSDGGDGNDNQSSTTETDEDADTATSIGFFVEDDGRGIPEEIRDQAFDSAVTTSSGLGIGLWVVREVATGHGWTTVATEGNDGGARFEFVFGTD